MQKWPLIGVLVIGMSSILKGQPVSPTTAPWIPDQGDGTYKNPVLFADYSDPDVIRVGHDFYLTASSFGCVPGLPILQSRDLINWKIVGHAVEKLPDRFDTPQASNGIWAPSIRYHDGWYWIFVGDPDWGILMTKTKDPAGKWEPLHVVQEGKGLIDTCPLWDDDGKAYLVHAFANSRAGRASILVVNEMSPDGTKLIGEEHLVVDGRNGVYPTIEGPKFYKRNGWYYIMAPAGGVRDGYEIAARSKNPFGPYEVKRVLEKGSTDVNGPHQGGWVELDPSTGSGQAGDGWFMHFQDRGAYGRITHLQPVQWVDDWPVMGEDFDKNGVGEPVASFKKPNVGMSYPIDVPQTTDEFNILATKLDLQWQWQANPQPNWFSLTARRGFLRLNAIPRPQGTLAAIPNLALQKFPAPTFKTTTRLEFPDTGAGVQAGLVVMGPSHSAILVSRGADGLKIDRINLSGGARGPATEQVEATASGLKSPIWLRVSVQPPGVCDFSYSADGQTFKQLGTPFTPRTGGWVGSKVGLLCVGESGYVDFDWFRVEP